MLENIMLNAEAASRTSTGPESVRSGEIFCVLPKRSVAATSLRKGRSSQFSAKATPPMTSRNSIASAAVFSHSRFRGMSSVWCLA